MNRRPGVNALLFLLGSLGLVVGGVRPATAQTPPARGPAATAPASALSGKPDVVILIFPLSNGQYTVSAVYAKQVPQKQAEDSIQQLLAAGGWQGKQFAYENRAAAKPAQDFGIPDTGPMSSITGFVSGAILGPDGTLSLGPFLMGFRDQSAVQVTVATPKDFSYRGPRAFHDPRVDFTCDQKEGALVCVANIKDHRMEELTLPRFDNATDSSASAAARPAAGPSNVLKIGAIFAAALAAAVVVFLLARRAIQR